MFFKNLLRIGAILVVVGVASLGSVCAAVTFDIQADALRTSSGALAPSSTLVLLVADTGNNGFGQISAGQALSVNSILGGSDDRIIGIWDMTLNNVAGYFGATPTNLEFSSITGWSAGDGLALVWFPTLNIGSLNGLTEANVTYGMFSGPPADGGAWITPESATASLYFFNAAGTISSGSLPASLGDASKSVAAVPEPNIALLALMGVFSIVFVRHRQTKFSAVLPC